MLSNADATYNFSHGDGPRGQRQQIFSSMQHLNPNVRRNSLCKMRLPLQKLGKQFTQRISSPPEKSGPKTSLCKFLSEVPENWLQGPDFAVDHRILKQIDARSPNWDAPRLQKLACSCGPSTRGLIAKSNGGLIEISTKPAEESGKHTCHITDRTSSCTSEPA